MVVNLEIDEVVLIFWLIIVEMVFVEVGFSCFLIGVDFYKFR